MFNQIWMMAAIAEILEISQQAEFSEKVRSLIKSKLLKLIR